MRSGAIESFLQDYLYSPVGLSLLFGCAGWGLSLVITSLLLPWLKNRKGMRWVPREDTVVQKAGTPSMGGIGIISAAVFGFTAVFVFVFGLEYLLHPTRLPFGFIVSLLPFPVLVLAHAVLGYIDDHSKATNRGGISSTRKLAGQILLAAAFLVVCYVLTQPFSSPSATVEPFFEKETAKRLFTGVLPLLGAALLIVGTSNAVNFTDGIDGLAAGLCVQVGVANSVVCAELLRGPSTAGQVTAVFLWISLGGACLGFLAFNKHPAKIFMGDTGSLALGAALGAWALLTGTLFLLPFVGFIFFVELFSVVAQVGYFKLTRILTGEGKRIFRRAPLHHHFELLGWSERRVVITFWLINLLTSIIGLAMWKTEMLPHWP